MGSAWSCGHRKRAEGAENGVSRTISQFSNFRRLSSARLAAAEECTGEPSSLLGLCLNTLARHIEDVPASRLHELPSDLCQLLADCLIASAMINEGSVRRLAGMRLYSLNLSACELPPPRTWVPCLISDSLRHLDLSKTMLPPDALSALPPLPHLSDLDLSYSPGLEPGSLRCLSGCPSLERLRLRGNDWVTPAALAPISALPRLSLLDLSVCRRAGSLWLLRPLRSLRVLRAGWCAAVSDADVRALACLVDLIELDLSGTRVGDAGALTLCALRQLRSLALSGTLVHDAALGALLGSLPRLERLDISRCTRVGEVVLARLGARALPPPRLAWARVPERSWGKEEVWGAHPRGGGDLRRQCVEPCSGGEVEGVCGAGGGASAESMQPSPFERDDQPDAAAPAPSADEPTSSRAVSLSASFPPRAGVRLRSSAALQPSASTGGEDCASAAGCREALCGESAISAAPLVALDLSYTGVTDAGLAGLPPESLRRLERLSLESCRVHDRGVSQLLAGCRATLQILDLTDVPVTSAILPALGRCSQLRELVLAYTEVGSAGLEALAGLTSLEKLNLDARGVGDRGVAAIAGLPGLKELDLFGSSAGDAACAALGLHARRLEALELCSGAVTDAGARHLARCHSLRRLSLAQNGMVGPEGARALGAGLAALASLNLSATRVGSSGIGGLAGLRSLHSLAVHDAGVGREAAKALGAALPFLSVSGAA